MYFGHPGFRVDTKYTKPPAFGGSVLYYEVTVNPEELATDRQRFERDNPPLQANIPSSKEEASL